MSDDTLRIVNQPGNLLRSVQNMIDQDAASQLFRATVVATTDTTVRIQRTGHDADTAEYAVLDNFPYPRVGDEVLMARVGSGWMVVGSVLRSGLAENYLKIETKLTIAAGGSIEDADGSVWDQDGITLIADALGSDTIRFRSAAFPNEASLNGVITEIVSSFGYTAQYKPAGSPTTSGVEAQGRLEVDGELAGGSLRIGRAGLEVTSTEDDDDNHIATLGLSVSINADGSSEQQDLRIGSSGPAGNDRVNLNFNNLSNGVSGRGVFSFGNTAVAPAVNPVAGGYLYVVAGALTWRGSSGTITTMAVA